MWGEESTIAAVFFSQTRAVNDATVTFDIYDCYVVWYEKLCIWSVCENFYCDMSHKIKCWDLLTLSTSDVFKFSSFVQNWEVVGMWWLSSIFFFSFHFNFCDSNNKVYWCFYLLCCWLYKSMLFFVVRGINNSSSVLFTGTGSKWRNGNVWYIWLLCCLIWKIVHMKCLWKFLLWHVSQNWMLGLTDTLYDKIKIILWKQSFGPYKSI